MRLSALVVGLIGVAACGTIDPQVGSGRITLSPQVEASFRDYQRKFGPCSFAVSVDGKTSSYYFNPSRQCDGFNAGRSIQDCEKKSGGVKCKIYASGRDVVWKEAGGSTAVAQRPASPMPTRPTAEARTKADFEACLDSVGAARKIEACAKALQDPSLSGHARAAAIAKVPSLCHCAVDHCY